MTRSVVWFKLFPRGRRGNLDRLERSRFPAVKAAVKASPQHQRQPDTVQRPLSTPYRAEQSGKGRCRSETRRLLVVRRGVLLLSSLRPRPALLWATLSRKSSKRQVPRVQPCLPKPSQRTAKSRRTASAVPRTPESFARVKKSDGSLSCLFNQFWQCGYREAR
jgi:hypothetical protein